MNVTFTEADGTEKSWENFRPGKMMSTEAEAVEKVTGMTFPEWGQAVLNGSTLAGRALVWVLKKRTEPTLRFRDVVYPVDSLLVALDEEEKGKIRERMELDDTLTEEERTQLLAALGESDLEKLDFDPEVERADPPADAPEGSETG